MNNLVSFLGKLRSICFATKLRSFLTIVALVIVGGGIWYVSASSNKSPSYQTEPAQKGTLVESVSASGNISSGTSVSITTYATGIVTAVYVKQGDSVTAGEKIADIALDSSSLQKQASAWANYLTAQSTLSAAKAKMNSLQATLFQANQAFMLDKGASQNPDTSDPKYIEENATWLQAEADYNNQSGVIAADQAALTSAWLSYQQYSSSITSPASGVISSLAISQGYPISTTSSGSSTGQSGSTAVQTSSSLGTITLPNGQTQATVNLSEVDAPKAAVGQKATMTLDAFSNKTFTGEVVAIDTNGVSSSGVVTYPATITFDSPDSTIYSNMGVNARIITKVKDNVLLVPSSAVVSQNGATFVRVMKNGQVQEIPVEVGDNNDTQTEIVSGLSEGDEVITSIVSAAGRVSGATSSPFSGTSGFGGLRGGFGGGGAGGGRTIIRGG